MDWVRKHKLPAIEAIQYNGWPCIELDNLWQALYLFFNTVQNHQIDSNLLEEISGKKVTR